MGDLTMTYAEAKREVAHLEAVLKEAEAALKVFPRGPMGLTPDAVKASPDYRAAKKYVDNAFAKLRAFNAWYTKAFKHELAAERKTRRG